MSDLLVQSYLRSGGTFETLLTDHAVKAKPHNGKVSFVYDQLAARDDDPLACQCRGLVLREGTWEVLAHPFNRFFNHGQAAAASIDWGTARFEEKLDGCFPYRTPLRLWGGGYVYIGDVVSKRLTPTLVGMDASGAMVPCVVTNWFDNGTKDAWLDIEFEGSRPSRPKVGSGRDQRMRVTPNHAIYINGEFRPAAGAQVGDRVLTPTNGPDAAALHVIRSGLLGDGSLSRNSRLGARYEEGHRSDHREYMQAVYSWLGGAAQALVQRTSGHGSSMLGMRSVTFEALGTLREEWYPGGRKTIPADLSWIDDFAVAKWYMDDGSLAHHSGQEDRALFATNGFSEADVERLGRRLSELYGIQYTVYNSRGWALRINAGRDRAIESMWRAIAPHVVPCMRYKLPAQYRSIEYAERSPGRIVESWVERKITRVTSVADLSKKEFPHGRRGFDISTTTTNYVANGALVHNSLIITYWDDLAGRWFAATHSMCEAHGNINGVGTFAELADRAARDEGVGAASLHDLMEGVGADRRVTHLFELTGPYNTIVCQYAELKLTLLGARDLDTGLELDPSQLAADFGWRVPRAWHFDHIDHLVEVIRDWDPREFEGVVVKDAAFNRIKVKSPKYLAVAHAGESIGSSWRSACEAVISGAADDIEALLPPLALQRVTAIKGSLARVSAQTERDLAELSPIDDMKTFALAAKTRTWPAALFALKRGKAVDMTDFLKNTSPDHVLGVLSEKGGLETDV